MARMGPAAVVTAVVVMMQAPWEWANVSVWQRSRYHPTACMGSFGGRGSQDVTHWRRLRLVLTLIVGCGGLVAGIGFTVHSILFLSRAERVSGVVAELAKADKGMVKPVVAYRVAEKEYRVAAGFASSLPSHGTGDAVDVLYDPGRPEGGHVSPYSQLWLTPLLCLLLGGIFTCAGLSGLRPKRVAGPVVTPDTGRDARQCRSEVTERGPCR